jgi:2-hydroxy-6-oxonona-2,4-dienedioate hydrolase
MFYHEHCVRPAQVQRGRALALPLRARAAGLRNDARVAATLTRYDLESIQTPTLVIALRDDLYGMFAGAQYTAQHVHGAEFICYDRGGHLWVGHQDALMGAVASFAMRADPATAEVER